MLRVAVTAVFGLLLTSLTAGCGGSDGVELATAGGTVTLQGAPVAGASVTFIPEKGPVAVGTTNDQGKFKLSTGGRPGASLGKCGVSVTLVAPSDELSGKTPEEQSMELTKKMGDAQGKYGEKESKSLVPEKYSRSDSSGLSFTVTSDASKNDFAITLEP